MCGLAGARSIKTLKINDKKILESIFHRGPDNQNFLKIKEKKNNLFFYFSRLAIQDLNKRSNQPYYFKNLILCYNGEIYNFKELKKFLQKDNIKFNTSSDTEVLIKLIFYKGLKFTLNKIEGMWAFSLYNKKTKKLILCRDRFGEKPLLYYKSKNSLFFGSELKVFKEFLKSDLIVDFDYVKKYLFCDYRYLNKQNKNFFKNIYKVPPGYYFEIDQKLKCKKINYFKFLNNKNKKTSLSLAIKKVETKISEIINNAVLSDRPVGFCLSGGIDSTGLVSVAKKKIKKGIKCFTVYTDDKKYDEFDMVNQTVKKLKLKHKWIKINRNRTLDNIKSIIQHRNYPILTVTSYIQWLMLKEIKKHGIKVIISGNGSDEIFSGYYDHHLAYLNDIKENKKLYTISLNNWKKNIKPLIRNINFKDYLNYSKGNQHLKIIKGVNVSQKFGKKKINFDFPEIKFTKSFLKNRMVNEMFYESVPVILQEEDTNAMQFSIENRSPYLNSDLYKFVINLNEKYFIKNGYAKYLLRQSLKKYSPRHILNNYEKIGFNISPDRLLNFRSKPVISIFQKNSQIYKIISKKKILKLLKNKEEISRNSNFLFKFLNAKIFIDANL